MGMPRFLIMKKKFVKIFIVCVAICCVLICKWSLLLFLAFYFMTAFTKRIIARLRENFPNWELFNRNLNRNYDYAVIGNSSGYNAYRKIPHMRNCLCWALPDQQFYMQKQVLNHFFSILKSTDGWLFQVTSQKELMEVDKKKVLSFHYSILHPWLYPDNHNRKQKLPYLWILNPMWFLKIIHINLFINNRTDSQALGSNLMQIRETVLFCKERNIKYTLVYKGKVQDEVLNQLNDMHIPIIDFRKWSEMIQ